MDPSSYAIGQAVFIRTDTADFQEKAIPFASLEEMVKLCSEPRPNLTLEKIIVHCLSNDEPTAVTLGFIAATKGGKPGVAPGQSVKSAPAPSSQWPY